MRTVDKRHKYFINFRLHSILISALMSTNDNQHVVGVIRLERLKGFTPGNLSDWVREYLKDQIFLGRYKAGDRVLESRLAEELEISRAPVREAIRELENQGLLRSVPRKGTFVVEFTEEDVKEIHDIRLHLEDRVFEKLIKDKLLEDDDFFNLKNIVEEMVQIASEDREKTDKVVDITKKDMEFHKYLWKKSGSKWTEKILSNLYYQLQLAMIIDSRLEGDLVEGVKKHLDIIKYLQRGDIKNTKKVLRDHILLKDVETLNNIVGT